MFASLQTRSDTPGALTRPFIALHYACRQHPLTICPASAATPSSPEAPSTDVQSIHLHRVQQCLRSVVGFTAAYQVVCALAVPTAQAAYEWKPRRHHRRLRQTRTATLQQQIAVVEKREDMKQQLKLDGPIDAKDALDNLGQGISNMGKQWQQKVQDVSVRQVVGIQPHTISVDRGAMVRSPVRLSSRAPGRVVSPAQGAWPRPGYQTARPATVLGILLVLAAVGSAVFALFGRQMGLRWRWGKAPEKGRWVRDRGLGGKLVFIPDEPAGKSPGALMSWDVDTNSPREAQGVADRELWEALGAPATAPVRPAAAAPLPPPAWWRPPLPPMVPASAAAKETARTEARSLLKALEDSKLLQGMDYSIDRLTALKRICVGVGIAARPKADNSRDAMFRSGVEAAVTAAMTGGAMSMGQLGGDSAPVLVCGLAAALQVPEQSAVTIVHAAIAAKAKALLTDALAAQLKGQTEVVLQELLRMSNLLDAFPLPPNTPEAGLVGSALLQRANLEFRKAVFMSFGYMNRQQAGTVAEMLGFNPGLVLPTLDSAVAARD